MSWSTIKCVLYLLVWWETTATLADSSRSKLSAIPFDEIDADGDGVISRREFLLKPVPDNCHSGLVSADASPHDVIKLDEGPKGRRIPEVTVTGNAIVSAHSRPDALASDLGRPDGSLLVSPINPLPSDESRADEMDVVWEGRLEHRVQPVPNTGGISDMKSRAERRQLDEEESECCIEILDSDTTCVITNRLYGDVAQGPTATQALCIDFCLETYPSASHTDFWPNIPWCNCYGSCDESRCVSRECYGQGGGDVTTNLFKIPAPPMIPSPPCPPLLPPAFPSPPPLPPAPPLPPISDSGEVTISISEVEYAYEYLADMIRTESVLTIILQVNISVKSSPLPEVQRPLQILGQCAEAFCKMTGNSLHRLLSVAAGGALYLERVRLLDGYASFGGAIYVGSGASVTLRHCQLDSNVATDSGGAVYLGTGSRLTSEGSVLKWNRAECTTLLLHGGGAIFAEDEALVQLLESSLVEGNYASSHGGGLYASSYTRVEICNMSALVGNRGQGVGGAVFIMTGSFFLQNSTLVENWGTSRGGAMGCYQDCLLELINSSTVALNKAGEHGGGVYAHAQSNWVLGPNTSISGNIANGSLGGGGLFLYEDSTMTLDNTKVVGNKGVSGGGIFLSKRTVLSISFGTVISGNTASS
ncbi:hypothetical protein CYMTET_10327, partial [Cymbomonas tetramitiformis]